jgi:NADPH-dependent curcumin reductase CurA
MCVLALYISMRVCCIGSWSGSDVIVQSTTRKRALQLFFELSIPKGMVHLAITHSHSHTTRTTFVRLADRRVWPASIDVVYESVGGEFFDTCVNALAIKGRLVVIGMISGYVDGTAWSASTTAGKAGASLSAKLLAKSASIRGFFLNHYLRDSPRHLARLCKLVEQGKLDPVVDGKHFSGLEQVPAAIAHMYSGNNIGKVIVHIADDTQEPTARL